MLRAHSLLWHYLWVAPNVLLLVLAGFMWHRRLQKKYPVFFTFSVCSAITQLALYFGDIAPAIDPKTWWKLFWVVLLVEGILKFAVIGEIFSQSFSMYASISKLGRNLIRGVGVVLVLTGALAAAYAPPDSRFGIVSGAHLLQQAVYLTESGLLVFIFLFVAYFKFRLPRTILGIAVGLAASACVHLGSWAIAANGILPPLSRDVLDFINMGTYHVSVLIWFYYLVVPHKIAVRPEPPIPESNLAVWNRELERLLQL